MKNDLIDIVGGASESFKDQLFHLSEEICKEGHIFKGSYETIIKV